MTFMPRGPWPQIAAHAIDLAEQVLARAESAPPSGLTGLAPRPRAAYDRMMDAVNRLPRPLMVLGSLALLVSALVAPEWFAARMEALADMPEALWWIIGAVLSLHFGARMQDHAQAFRREMAHGAAAEPPLPADPAPAHPGPDADLTLSTLSPDANPALEAWRATRA